MPVVKRIDDKVLFGGLVERDLLRLELGLCLSGTEFDESMNIDFKALNMDFMMILNLSGVYYIKVESNGFLSINSTYIPGVSVAYTNFIISNVLIFCF